MNIQTDSHHVVVANARGDLKETSNWLSRCFWRLFGYSAAQAKSWQEKQASVPQNIHEKALKERYTKFETQKSSQVELKTELQTLAKSVHKIAKNSEKYKKAEDEKHLVKKLINEFNLADQISDIAQKFYKKQGVNVDDFKTCIEVLSEFEKTISSEGYLNVSIVNDEDELIPRRLLDLVDTMKTKLEDVISETLDRNGMHGKKRMERMKDEDLKVYAELLQQVKDLDKNRPRGVSEEGGLTQIVEKAAKKISEKRPK
ncbi:MAG: hypothetical protein A2Y14_04155 [Verrucomicrobia bacterium GWF2_51_19]|nr:MAG: hypothetical protein A2Y14_04155 [Verrucomicrobia bacterium GWF2_51_19]HCJ11802.1 hypothetical protein [Opitutae bacterium]